MMAVILFLSLILVSSGVNAQEIIDSSAFLDEGGLAQPLLEERLSLRGKKRRAYRGGKEGLLNNTVSIRVKGSSGAGVVLDDASAQKILPMFGKHFLSDKRLIVTNFHVIHSGEAPMVMFIPADGLELETSEIAYASVVSTVPEKDLALLLVNARPAHVTGVSLASVSRTNIGDDVEAVGHPGGQMWTYTRGYISQVRANYEWSYDEKFILKADVVQTQTPISAGNSGGPLFNREGKLVGINTLIRAGQNLNFAVSTSEFEHLANGSEQVEVMKSVRGQFGWDEFPQLMQKKYREVDRGKLPSGYEYQKFVSIADPSIAFRAIYKERSALHRIFQTKKHAQGTLHVELNPNHTNSNAWYKATVRQGKKVISQGWDFDGDFVIDYLN